MKTRDLEYYYYYYYFLVQDPHGGPGQVARVVEGRRLVDLLLGLVAALLHLIIRMVMVVMKTTMMIQ